jgi:hypothetical protein
LGIGVTRVLDSLHCELPVHETLKRSKPLDPKRREPLDLIQKLEYRVSGFEASKDLTLFHFKLLISEVLIWPGPLDQGGRITAVDLLEGKIFGFRGLQSRKNRLACIAESRNAKRRLVVWPVVITNDHMEVEKGRSSLR